MSLAIAVCLLFPCVTAASEMYMPRRGCDFVLWSLCRKVMLPRCIFFFNSKLVRTLQLFGKREDAITCWRVSSLPLKAGGFVFLVRQFSHSTCDRRVSLALKFRIASSSFWRWVPCASPAAQGVKATRSLLHKHSVNCSQCKLQNARWRGICGDSRAEMKNRRGYSSGAGVCLSLGYSPWHIWCWQSWNA